MRFAILAAGEGSRLAQEGIQSPKPLVRVAGECLIDRLLRIFDACGADEIVVICNALTNQVRDHLRGCTTRARLTVLQQTTPSSMHSMGVLAPYLRGGKFIATTCDTIFDEREFIAYARSFAQNAHADGMMAATRFVDDEKPLWIQTDGARIVGFHDTNADGRCSLVSGGIYGLNERALDILAQCLAQGKARMRNFQRELVAQGLCLEVSVLDHVLDIDHAADIAKAEKQIAIWKNE